MINLICKNLRKEEIYVQISDCFEQLEKITNDAFEKIDIKLESMNCEIIQIEKRREFVKLKIEKIKENKNKAIKIISPLEYPIKRSKEDINYEPIFNFNTNFEYKIKNNEINQKFELFHVDDLNEKLNFCDLDLFLKTADENLNVNFLKSQNNDLTIPWNKIKSISSLIVFNSSETAYVKTDQDSSIVDFKILKTKKIEDENDYDSFNFGPPPKSMIENNKMKELEKNLFNYDQQEAPEILDNFPNDLPDLGAVADDIFFEENEEVQFNFFENKKIDYVVDNKNKPSSIIKIFSIEETTDFSENQLNNKIDDKKNNLNKSLENLSFIPPPPPPLPTTNISETIIEKPKDIPIINPLAQIDNSRSSLLDAIRKAGGKPEKSKVTIKEKKLEEKKNRKEAVSTDLMSDLKKHLMSRRQGMVGKGNDLKINQPEKKSSNSSNFNKVFDSMNRLLPSPSHSSGSSGEDSNDEDWINT